MTQTANAPDSYVRQALMEAIERQRAMEFMNLYIWTLVQKAGGEIKVPVSEMIQHMGSRVGGVTVEFGETEIVIKSLSSEEATAFMEKRFTNPTEN